MNDAVARALRESTPEDLRVTLLPDFFLDHFVTLGEFRETIEAVEGIHARGGGNLRVPEQVIRPGGNAANTALALARLGLRASLVTRTSPYGADFLQSTLGRAGVDLSRVRDDGDLAVTTALEFPDANVMLSTSGSVADFGPDALAAEDRQRIRESNAVLVANFQNRHATDLALEACRIAREGGARTFVDTGDPGAFGGDVGAFLERLVPSGDVDAFGINENELRHYHAPPKDDPAGYATAAAAFSARAGGRVDLHTSRFAVSFHKGRFLGAAPAFEVELRRATGCGDAWNAGNVLGDLLGLQAAGRLTVANAVAAAYGSSPEARHPDVDFLAAFVEETPRYPLPAGLTSAP